MTIRNPNWYDLNSQRPWPLDDAATLVDDGGTMLPHDILVDLYLRFPESLGDRLWLSALTVGPGIVTAVLSSSAFGTPPVASVNIPQPADIGRQYFLEGMVEGVFGWIAVGSGTNVTELKSYRFSNPTQSLLQARSASKYSSFPVQSIGKLSASPPLSGLIRLKGGNDVRTELDSREIQGILRDVVVIRLDQDPEVAAERNLYDIYRGPCGRRPESGNCSETEPIEFVNNVAPDCCGMLTIEFRGCAAISEVTNESCAVIIDCGHGLSEACLTQDQLPDETGRLPNEYADLCASYSSSVPFVPSEPVVSSSYSPVSGPESLMVDLPYLEDFEDGLADDFLLVTGIATVAADTKGGQSYITDEAGGRTIAIIDTGFPETPDWTTMYKTITTNMVIDEASPEALHQGGTLFNYRPALSDPVTRKAYWFAELRWDSGKSISIRKYNGYTFSTEATASVVGLTLGNSYKLTVTIEPMAADSSHAWITARVEGNDDAIDVTLGPVFVLDYAPAEGKVGFISQSSRIQFQDILVEDYTVI